MASFEGVFERVEKKYVLDPIQRASMERALSATHRVDEYGTSLVTSVYWDTPAFSVIGRSLERPLYKEKLRARAYGAEASQALMAAIGADVSERRPALAEPNPTLFLELKKKLDGVVYKRRVPLSPEALGAWMEGAALEEALCSFPLGDRRLQAEALDGRSRQIARELERFRERFDDEGLAPAAAIACERTALAPREGTAGAMGRLRVTFDGALRFLPLATGRCEGRKAWTPLLPGSATVMELKSLGAFDLGFSRLLSRLRVFPRSFSKYGTAARRIMADAGSESVRPLPIPNLEGASLPLKGERVA